MSRTARVLAPAAVAIGMLLPLCAAGPLAAPALAATAASTESVPTLSARSAILVDARGGEVLLAWRPDQRRAVASATKLMTAVLALERASPDDVFVAPPYAASSLESQIGLRPAERMTVGDLLRALLLESANDAAATIAVNHSGSGRAFVREMNRRAHRLRLRGTHFANPIGLDDPLNFSTARDLAALARVVVADRRLARIVDQPRAELRSGDRPRVVTNRNVLVRRFPFVDGVKTGHTAQAGWVLVGSASGRGARVISVVLGEPTQSARDADSLALLRYGLAAFRRVRVLASGRALARPRIRHRDERAELVPARALTVTVRRGQRLETRIDAPAEVEGALPARARLGSATVLLGGRTVGRVALVTGRAVPEAPALRRLSSAPGLSVLLVAMLFAGTLLGLRLRAVRRRRAPTRR